ncbi:alpha/beta hydrolase family protein [Streptomyces sp. NPDC048696]|uniref:alpha/beta hydrolase family protein n=1 Tax=Streptomyces sp. NPDC048696 TaxID=3365585 RepID=UPI003715DC49
MVASVSRRSLLGAGAGAAVLVATTGGSAFAAARPGAAPGAPSAQGVRLTLPAPTGPHPVGTVSVRLVDRSRRDPWVSTRPYRELMVSVRHPARDVRGHRLAPQMLPGAAADFDRLNSLEGVPHGKVDWAATRSHAYTSAPVGCHGLPVVLYSPGAGDPRTLGTTLCDELASRGYAVVMVDHTYDAGAVEFPGSRVERTVLGEEYAKAEKAGPAAVTALLKKAVDVRVADTRYVLDRLGALSAALPGGSRGTLDLSAVGMFGQSAGGFTAAQTMHDDRRLRAVLNMDGVMGYVQNDDDPANPSPVGTDGLDRPLLLMGKDGNDHHTVPSWGLTWDHSSGWHRDLTLCGGEHASFTDLQSQVPQIGRALGLTPEVVAKNVGTVDPARSVAAQRAYVSAFFDRWLRGGDGALLDGPSARWPEVRFVK